MNAAEGRPDVRSALSRLKGFQRVAVDQAFHRLYEADDSTHRYLVADEVGLGKTLIARGIIARAVDHLWESVPRIDVVYLCSNASIARQNLARLAMPEGSFAQADRITLLPLALPTLAANKLNFIALTPSTSLDLASRTGTAEERALVYWLLPESWRPGGLAPINVLQWPVRSPERFRAMVRDVPNARISTELTQRFRDLLSGELELERDWRSLCERLVRIDAALSAEDASRQLSVVGKLRRLVARSCVHALEPDLVILDEVQRFKHLLDDESDAGQLARDLFSYSHGTAKARVLLLSATPYKMYTVAGESGDDDEPENHYEDFLRTIRFLEDDAKGERTNELRADLDAWRRQLLRIGSGEETRLYATRQSVEARLRRVMSRTERVRVGGGGDSMLRQAKTLRPHLEPNDALAFVDVHRVAQALGVRGSVEYWRSAPYLLNVMEDYDLGRRLRDALESSPPSGDVASALHAARGSLLPFDRVEAYSKLEPPNAALRALADDVFDAESWRLLWLPPTLPAWRLEGAYLHAQEVDFTKRLVFSSWAMVPRALSTLLSFEAERRVFRAEATDGEPLQNTPEARRRRHGLLRFAVAEGRPTGMPALALMYPSVTLARLGDPLPVTLGPTGSLPTLKEVRIAVEQRIEDALAPIVARAATTATPDEAWYWAAPVLLDATLESESTLAWWSATGRASSWSAVAPEAQQLNDADVEGEVSSGPTAEGDGAPDRFSDHVDLAAAVAAGNNPFGLGTPPPDLVAVLAALALGAPGIVALRALSRVCGGAASLAGGPLRDAASRIGWHLRGLFNGPEATAIIRTAHPHMPFWRAVLEESCAGALASVLEEHVHLLRDSLGLFDSTIEKRVDAIAESVHEALAERAIPLELQEIAIDNGEELEGTGALRKRRMRTHFAMRYGAGRGEDQKTVVATEKLRAAFNSPFWPFVLVTTSVGQEGLDFHPWCHAIVHWNLPSNPVDMEQREGRVHRYKGHAVRKNVARSFGRLALGERSLGDVWERAFDLALEGAREDHGGLVPYWTYPIDGGACIERHVPILPLSRDVAKFENLRRSLAVYRMVFGQPRQDELLAWLMEHVPEAQLRRHAHDLRIDLSPRAPTS